MSLNRRQFLKTSIVAAGTVRAFSTSLANGGVGIEGRTRPGRSLAVVPSLEHFPQSVASGDPKPGSVILWTRVADEHALGDRRLLLEVWRDPDGDEPGTAAGVSPSGPNFIVRTLVVAHENDDGCVRVKIVGLTPDSTYKYRFIYRRPTENGATLIGTRIGRTRTAPAAADAAVCRFALVSCQDFIGKYYNAYLPLLTPEYDDLRFVLHVGDFIYETTGDPSFQGSGDARNVAFADASGAIRFGDDPDNPDYLAARSLSNYRELYRTYRSDEVLQEVLLKFPLVHIWDDHEFSDDGYRLSSTYFDGLGFRIDRRTVSEGDGSRNTDERDLGRRRNAERAYLEYMPIDDLEDSDGATAPVSMGIIDTGRDKLFPKTRLYRGLRFGKHCNVLLTDYRTYRPAHVVGMDVFPATVIAPESEIRRKYDALSAHPEFARTFDGDTRRFTRRFTASGAIVPDLDEGNPSGFREYIEWVGGLSAGQSGVNMLTFAQKTALLAQVGQDYVAAGYSDRAAAGKARRDLRGLLDIEYLNARLQAYNRAHRSDAGFVAVPTIRLNIDIPGARKNPYGLCYFNLSKIGLANFVGTRYAQDADWFELWRALESDRRAVQTAGADDVPLAEDAYGEQTFGSGQETWLKQSLAASDSDWNVVVSTVSSSSVIIDLDNPKQWGRETLDGELSPALEALRKLLVRVLRVLGLGTRLYVTSDHWDGMPSKRHQLHELYRDQGNVVLLSGDIHSTWVNDLTVDGRPLVDFTGTSISSATFGGILTNVLAQLNGSTAVGADMVRPTTPFGLFVRAVRFAAEAGERAIEASELAKSSFAETLGQIEQARRGVASIDLAGRDSRAAESGASDVFTALVDELIAALDDFFVVRNHTSEFLRTADLRSKIKSELVGVDTSSNGVAVMEVRQHSVRATYLLISPADVTRSFYEDRSTLLSRVETREFLYTREALTEVSGGTVAPVQRSFVR